MVVYFSVVSFIFGLIFGSFGNCWAWRLVHHESIVKGRSHCATCNHELGALDLIPLFSWIFLKGKCRYCGEKISVRYPLAELILGLYFLTVFLVYGLSLECLRLMILGFLLLVMSLVDLDIMELPDGLMIAAAVCALLRLPNWKSILLGLVAISVPVLLISLVMDKVLGKESIGGGDIKLLAVLGMHFGAGKTLLLLIVSCLLGIGFAYLAKKGKGKEFPFGPILALSSWFTALFGNAIINWYTNFF